MNLFRNVIKDFLLILGIVVVILMLMLFILRGLEISELKFESDQYKERLHQCYQELSK